MGWRVMLLKLRLRKLSQWSKKLATLPPQPTQSIEITPEIMQTLILKQATSHTVQSILNKANQARQKAMTPMRMRYARRQQSLWMLPYALMWSLGLAVIIFQ